MRLSPALLPFAALLSLACGGDPGAEALPLEAGPLADGTSAVDPVTGLPVGEAPGSLDGTDPSVEVIQTQCVGDLMLEDFESAGSYPLLRSYNDGSPGGTMSPAPGTSFQAEMSDEGSLALHMVGSGFGSWGAGIGRLFEAPVECRGRSVGIRFRAKGNGIITFAGQVSAVIPVDEGGSCTAGEACNNGHQRALNLGSTWQDYEILWTDLAQITDSGWESILTTFDPRSVLELLFAARPEAMPFDFWIDNIQLIDDGSPAVAEPTPLPGSGGGDDGTSTPPSCILDPMLGEAGFNSMFAARRNGFYTYAGLCAALKKFPSFANTGNSTLDKRELAAFLANVARETGELEYIKELAPQSAQGQYYGRGPIQLSWDFNYRAAGSFLGVDLIANPDLLATDSIITWESALWFWVHNDGSAKGTCHDAIHQSRGFGQTINIINGGFECPSGGNSAAQQRISYFKSYCSTLGVDPGSSLDC